MTSLTQGISRLHFVGIGGIGMSGIAEVFSRQGFSVSGSDAQESDTTRRLRGLGIQISVGHRPENVHGASVVITSSAVKDDNPEKMEAKRMGIPVIPRAEMLGELMRGKNGIALAGTHGKTTTTTMMGTVLNAEGWDPTVVVGGRVDAFGGNARWGKGHFVVAEADESDGSFSHLPAVFATVTNIDSDHLDYYVTMEALDRAFIDFVNKLPFYGMAAVCWDDPGVQRCFSEFRKPVVTYGFSHEADTYADQIHVGPEGSEFQVYSRVREGTHSKDLKHFLVGKFRVRVPGRHNILNALSVISIARRLRLPADRIAAGLAEFQGVQRRFQTVHSDASRKIRVLDDYGHHPTEILATLQAARSVWPGRIFTVFQPHRYSRLKLCYDEFKTCFGQTDVLWLTDIYAAGESAIPDVSSEKLASDIVGPKVVAAVGGIDGLDEKIAAEVRDGDLVLCMGAGSITSLAKRLAERLSLRKPAASAE